MKNPNARSTYRIINEIAVEREVQVAKYPDAVDAKHTSVGWLNLLRTRLGTASNAKTVPMRRRRLVQLATLCVAWIEQIDKEY